MSHEPFTQPQNLRKTTNLRHAGDSVERAPRLREVGEVWSLRLEGERRSSAGRFVLEHGCAYSRTMMIMMFRLHSRSRAAYDSPPSSRAPSSSNSPPGCQHDGLQLRNSDSHSLLRVQLHHLTGRVLLSRQDSTCALRNIRTTFLQQQPAPPFHLLLLLHGPYIGQHQALMCHGL